MHVIESYYDSPDDENKECYAAKFLWPTQNKLITCPSLKLIHKNRQEDLKFTFDDSKCDRSFDEFLKFGYIRITHTLSSLEELKRKADWKYHNSFFLMPLMITICFLLVGPISSQRRTIEF